MMKIYNIATNIYHMVHTKLRTCTLKNEFSFH